MILKDIATFSFSPLTCASTTWTPSSVADASHRSALYHGHEQAECMRGQDQVCIVKTVNSDPKHKI
jgi:hypothetical protein